MRCHIIQVFEIVIGITFAFIIAEGAIRITAFEPPNIGITDSRTGLAIYPPHSTFLYSEEGCLENIVSINSLGFHAPEYFVTKPPGVYRIIVLGNSFVEARHVPTAQLFTTLLETQLNQRGDGRRYEVIPFAHAGNGPYLNLLYLQQYALQFQPDLILNTIFTDSSVAYELGDRPTQGNFLPRFDERHDLIPPSFTKSPDDFFTRFKNLVRKSRLENILYRRFYAPLKALPLHTSLVTGVQAATINPWIKEEKIFQELIETTRRNKAHFVTVSFLNDTRTFSVRALQEIKNHYPAITAYDIRDLHPVLSSLADYYHFPYHNIFSLFEELKGVEPTNWSCNGHWNTHGHAVVADALYKVLTQSDTF